MSKFKFDSREHVALKAEEEGLGYFLIDYTGPDSMPDEELKEAFIKARDAINEFEKLINTNVN